jgi:hypothetical protein
VNDEADGHSKMSATWKFVGSKRLGNQDLWEVQAHSKDTGDNPRTAVVTYLISKVDCRVVQVELSSDSDDASTPAVKIKATLLPTP